MKFFLSILPTALFTAASYPLSTTISEQPIGKLYLSDGANCEGEGDSEFLIPQSAGCVNITRPFRSYEPLFETFCRVGFFEIYRLPDCRGPIAANSTRDLGAIVDGNYCYNLREGEVSVIADVQFQRQQNQFYAENKITLKEAEQERERETAKNYRIENGSAIFTCSIDE